MRPPKRKARTVFENHTVKVVIPALNEAASVTRVLAAIPDFVDEIIVVDNGSTDGTDRLARENGARVVAEPRRGYGQACQTGIAACEPCDIIVFLDADFSDHAEQMPRLVEPIANGTADLVIGSRVLGRRQRGALTPQARFGNRLACWLIRRLWHVRFTDLGPFRAIRASALKALNMIDTNYGWTVEMQIKATQRRLSIREVPVDYRRRIGRSKISGTLRGILGAGTKILGTIVVAAITECLADKALIVFTRYPEPGRTKTRLIPTLGPQAAADLHHHMTQHTIHVARTFTRKHPCALNIQYAGGDPAAVREWLGPDLTCLPQPDGDLGQRLAAAFRNGFQHGRTRIVIIGTDCPDLTPTLLQTAFNTLRRHDLVLGPAADGGYYLIGLRAPAADRAVPNLFENVDFGTGRVLDQTITIARAQRLTFKQLKTLQDVDRPEDLPVWHRAATTDTPRITAIIPTRNEADLLPALLDDLRHATHLEIIVADGGSTDDTTDVARARGVSIIVCPPDRAVQMNMAATQATGDVLLFLHADTRVPRGFDLAVRRALADRDVIAGAFELKIDAPQPALRLIERLANWRSRHLRLPYGDQGIFVRANVFRKIAGYRNMPIMADYDLTRRLGAHGRITIIPLPATTSPRRWLTVGILKTTIINQAIIAAYHLGIAPATLRRWYR